MVIVVFIAPMVLAVIVVVLEVIAWGLVMEQNMSTSVTSWREFAPCVNRLYFPSYHPAMRDSNGSTMNTFMQTFSGQVRLVHDYPIFTTTIIDLVTISRPGWTQWTCHGATHCRKAANISRIIS